MVLKCFLLAFLCLCPTLVQADRGAYLGETEDANKIALMSQGMNSVRSKLDYPEATKFREVFFHKGYACGEVNIKNSFGDYNGFERFIFASTLELSILETQISDFRFSWAQHCG